MLLLLFEDIRGMCLIDVVLMGLETKFDKDLMGDCSKSTASAEEDVWKGEATTGTMADVGIAFVVVVCCPAEPAAAAFVVTAGVRREPG